MLPRRFLPPTSLLASFEAAARTQSFTLAARELSLTQSAVSRQIRALEELLGAPLFRREKQKVSLTLAGKAYAREIRDALNRISNATLSFRAHPVGASLQIAVVPLFGSRWLTPRLARFITQHPEISVNLTTRTEPFDFRLDTVDAAIHFGLPEWPGARLDFLMEEQLVPACSPAFREQLGGDNPAGLLGVPLLHLVSRPDAWERWFAGAGVDPGEVRGMLFDQFTPIIEAARAGLGVALLPKALTTREFERGELVQPVDAIYQGPECYYLSWPDTHEGHPPLEVFRAWILQEMQQIREAD